MPASLVEAFSAPSTSNTESLRNPDYRRYGQGYGGNGGRNGGGSGSSDGNMLGGGSDLFPYSQHAMNPTSNSPSSYQQEGGGGSCCDPYPRLGNQDVYNRSLTPISHGLGPGQSHVPTISTATLDGETKCDLHIYHILSCPECRERIKKLLADPTQQTSKDKDQSQNTPSSGSGSGLAGILDMFGGGSASGTSSAGEVFERFLGLQISEKLDQLLSRKNNDDKLESSGTVNRGFEGLMIYLLLGIFLIFVLDMITRMR